MTAGPCPCAGSAAALSPLALRIRCGAYLCVSALRALGDHLPNRDLLISPDHAVLINNILVNAGALVNGVTIRREPAMPGTFVYYHIEVDEHELILAEGVSAETFINHVDRMAFDNWSEHSEIFGDTPEKPEMSYARVKSARQLPRAIRERMGALVAETSLTAA